MTEGPFPIEDAPRDGTTILVFHGARCESARAYWQGRFQCWTPADVRGGTEVRALQNVRFWEPL